MSMILGGDHDSLSVLLAAIEGSCGQMLNEADSLSDLDLLLLGELAGWAGHVGGRIEDLRDLRDGAVGLLWDRGKSVLLTTALTTTDTRTTWT